MRVFFGGLAGVLALLAVLFLARGQVTAVYSREAACQRTASNAQDHSLPGVIRYRAEARRVESCMRASGYGFRNSSACPEDAWGSASRRSGIRALQEEDAACYAPIGWGPRQLYWIDVWFHKALETIGA